jgi:hypothetical protein
MKKQLTIMAVIAGSLATYNLLNKKSETQNNQTKTVVEKSQVEQSVTTASSSIKKKLDSTQLQDSSNSNLKNSEDLKKKELVTKLLEKMSPEKLNKSFEVALGRVTAKEKSEKKKAEILEFLKSYPFAQKLEQAYSKLSLEELEAMAEIQMHPTSQKLQDKQVETQEKFMEQFKSKKPYELAEDKKVLVNQIIEESSLLERAQSSSKSIIETAIAYTESQKNNKLSPQEAMAKAKEKSAGILKAQEGNISMAFDISYDFLSKEELQAHLRMLQRTDAKKAYEVAMKASDSVYKEFILEFLKAIK